MTRRPDPRQASLLDLFDRMVMPPTLPPGEALVAAGVTTPFLLTLGPLQDPSVPPTSPAASRSQSSS